MATTMRCMAAAFPAGAAGPLRLALGVLALVAATACDGGPAAPRPAPALEVVSGQAQEGLEGRALPDAVVVRLRDADGRPLAGVPLEVRVEGGGRVVGVPGSTGAAGRTPLRWELGPAPEPQRLVVRAGGAEAEVTARALPLARADVVLLRGARGPVAGLALLRERFHATEVVLEVPEPDSVVHLQPRADETGLLVLPTADALEWRDVAWTPAPDTVVVEMRPPVAVDVRVRIYTAPFDSVRALARADLQRTDGFWRDIGLGIRLGEVTFEDAHEPGRVVDVDGPAICRSPARIRIELSYVHRVGGRDAAGYGCPPGQAFVAGSERYPWLVAHELGHVFTLRHQSPGLMEPAASGPYLTQGQIWRANFNARSGLNVLFDAHPESARRACGGVPPCLPSTWRLGDGG